MNKKSSVLINSKIKKFNKTIKIPSDKSCSIRALIFGSQVMGISNIKNLLESEDVLNCVKALRTLGVKIVKSNDNDTYKIYGNGLGSFRTESKTKKIFVGNSGTTARILCGLLAVYPGRFYLYGDKSMNKRDMSRIIVPLEKVGAFFYPKGKKTLPITIEGTTMPLAQNHIEHLGSAQVKSSLLASFLNCPGISILQENRPSRDHTEILLKKIGADIKIKKLKKGNLISVRGQKNLHAFDYTVSSDPSSAAFLIALTLLTPKSKITIHNCLLNKTRFGFYKVLKEKPGANIKIKNLRKSSSGELVGSIIAKSSSLKPINCPKEVIPSLIDELPLMFVLSALTKGTSKFNSISELANKESSRAVEMKKILTQAGIKCKTTKNSMIIYGKDKIETQKKYILVKTRGDHRICMSATILSLATGIKTKIDNFETDTSFPNFLQIIKKLGGQYYAKKS